MAYVLANKGSKNQMLYSFEPSFNIKSIEYKTVRLEHVQYDHQGNILIDSDTLKEFEILGIPIFEKKSSAKEFLVGHDLGAHAKYVGIRYKRAYEHNFTSLSALSSWTGRFAITNASRGTVNA
ncbi:hypothetical protein [Vibrio cholerae]|uniref:hypothetical protein n=1 Tax=Vibrio cholerae TaxID=666 RepID=UPI0018F0DE6A|nr:hypothetical protein [Vibrio cholerae]EKF9989629.1 hypothetical protein [Vibrio cholerae]MBJ6911065.1 hypothetical protein [Vibrio cholerae]HDI3182361.1 hypothetical protein [Vibrio cholerae]